MRQLKHRHLTWVADQIPPFLAHIQAVRYSPKTVRNYRYCLRAVERAIGLPLLIASATDLETYLAHLSRSKVTTATLAKAQNSLRVFFRWAVKYGHLRTDPTIGFESPTSPTGCPAISPSPRWPNCSPACLLTPETRPA